MIRTLTVSLCIVALVLAPGCAATDIRPVIDPRSSVKQGADYEADLRECQELAEGVRPEGSAAAGLIVGALLGAALGAVTGAPSANAGLGAGLGAATGGIAGGAGGALSAAHSHGDVVRRCLAGRGYAVLDG